MNSRYTLRDLPVAFRTFALQISTNRTHLHVSWPEDYHVFGIFWFMVWTFSVVPGWSHLTDLLLICQRGWNRQLVLLSWWWTFQKKSHVTLTKVGVPRPFEPLRVSGAVKPVLHQAMIDFRDQTWIRINKSPMMSDAVSHVLYRTFRTVTASKYKEVLFPFTSFADLSWCFFSHFSKWMAVPSTNSTRQVPSIIALIGSFFHRFLNSLFHCFIDSLVHWFIDCLIHWFSDSLIGCFTDSLVHRFDDPLHWFVGSLIHLIIDSVIDSLPL